MQIPSSEAHSVDSRIYRIRVRLQEQALPERITRLLDTSLVRRIDLEADGQEVTMYFNDFGSWSNGPGRYRS